MAVLHFALVIISRRILLRMTNVTDKFVQKNKNKIIFPPENRTVYEVMWNNMVESARPQKTYNTAHALCMLYN